MDQSTGTSSESVTLYAWPKHGGHPVHVVPGKRGTAFQVDWSATTGGIATYPSARQLVRALYNRGDITSSARDPGMTFERYFHLGRHRRGDDVVGPTIFDYFGTTPLPPEPVVEGLIPKAKPEHRRAATQGRRKRVIPVETLAVTTLDLFGSGELVGPVAPDVGPRWAEHLSVQHPVVTRPSKPKLSVDPRAVGPIGIDLHNRSHEVRKLLFAGFGGRIARGGYDPDDVLQEVYKGLLTRNRGTCRFDPSKSSFGHYVHMVAGCVLANYHRKYMRLGSREQVGMYVRGSSESEKGQQADAALAATNLDGNDATEVPARETMVIESLRDRVLEEGSSHAEAPLAAEAIPFVYAGCTRAEIAQALGTEPSRVGRALAFLRNIARPWMVEEGLRPQPQLA